MSVVGKLVGTIRAELWGTWISIIDEGRVKVALIKRSGGSQTIEVL